jgi:chaperonin GroEL (HSP60 family)
MCSDVRYAVRHPARPSRKASGRRRRAPARQRSAQEDQNHGVEIVRKALSWPAPQIALDAGEDGSEVISKTLEKDTYGFGFDAQTGEYGNLVSCGQRCKAPRRSPGF